MVPIVQNLYQRQKSILEGFMLSLMTRELIVLFRWSDRCRRGDAFKDMKNISLLLLNSMLQIDPDYTVYQFEIDCKIILKKLIKIEVRN